MKRLLAVLLLLCLLPVLSFAENDPIVGCWYFFYDSSLAPELSSLYPDMDKEVSVYFFNADGSIYVLDAQISDNNCSPSYSVSDKWQLVNDMYVVSLVGIGKTYANVSDDSLFIKILDSDYFVTYKKLYPFDYYSDFVRK